MKKGVIRGGWRFFLWATYMIAPVIGYWYGGPVWCLCGIGSAVLIEGFLPKWVYDISPKDIEKAIRDQFSYGCNGSRLYIDMAGRPIVVYRDEKQDYVRMGVSLPLKDWDSILSMDCLEALAKRVNGWYVLDEWRGKRCFSCFPQNYLEGTVEFVNSVMKKHKLLHSGDIYARIDCVKKDIWAD